MPCHAWKIVLFAEYNSLYDFAVEMATALRQQIGTSHQWANVLHHGLMNEIISTVCTFNGFSTPASDYLEWRRRGAGAGNNSCVARFVENAMESWVDSLVGNSVGAIGRTVGRLSSEPLGFGRSHHRCLHSQLLTRFGSQVYPWLSRQPLRPVPHESSSILRVPRSQQAPHMSCSGPRRSRPRVRCRS